MGTDTNTTLARDLIDSEYLADLPIDQAHYDRLRRIASSLLHREYRSHSLEPEDLLHEVLLRLLKGLRTIHFKSWDHLRRTATVSMRHALVDLARAERAVKRGEGAIRVEIQPHCLVTQNCIGEAAVLSQALRHLDEADRRKSRVAEMHLLSAFSFEEIARELSVSTRTVKRDWKDACGFLRRELGTSQAKPARSPEGDRSNCKTRSVRVRPGSTTGPRGISSQREHFVANEM